MQNRFMAGLRTATGLTAGTEGLTLHYVYVCEKSYAIVYRLCVFLAEAASPKEENISVSLSQSE